MKKEQLDRLHSVEIEILDAVVDICNKHDIRCFLFWGTLLGAVRHKGFIPWDDDIDIAMPRDDFMRFCAIASNELPEDLYLHYSHDIDYFVPFAKVKKQNTVFEENHWRYTTGKNGIFIDIFPLDYVRSLRNADVKHKIASFLQRSAMYKCNCTKPKDFFPRLIDICLKPFSIRIILNIIDWMAQNCKNGKYVFSISSVNGALRVEWLSDRIALPFEGKQYWAPIGYKELLNVAYGDDFMQLPPPEKRITHNPVRLSFNTDFPDEVLND